MKISEIRLTPVAVQDMPLLNTKGVHGSHFLRTIIEVVCDDGTVGLGETYGAIKTLEGLQKTAPNLIGLDPFRLNDLRQRVEASLPDAGGINHKTMLTQHQVVDVVYSAFEIPCLDIQGHATGRPVCDLLGGAVRETVGFAAYLFFKFAKPSDQPGPDLFGEVMTPDSLVDQASAFVSEHGFRSLKLKGGVLDPDLEIETMGKLRDRFPDHPLRIDPMGAWRVPTAKRVCDALQDTLEYLEDPVRGMHAMAELSARTSLALSTNLVVVEFEHVFEAYRRDAVQIILSDHHYWRGATGARHLGEMCRAAGMGISMHSNTHLGISLAAMTHVAAATPGLTYDCDTHYPWAHQDVITGGKWQFNEGMLDVPKGPGLGVSLDRDAVAELHEDYNRLTQLDRNDTEEIKRYIPDYVRQVPRW
ncbi:MAG: enolase C-terminal domain-like protein [Pseudomonadota bacterium]